MLGVILMGVILLDEGQLVQVGQDGQDDSYATAPGSPGERYFEGSSDEDRFTDTVEHQGMQPERRKFTIDEMLSDARKRNEEANEDGNDMVSLDKRTDLTPALARKHAAEYLQKLQQKRKEEEMKRNEERSDN